MLSLKKKEQHRTPGLMVVENNWEMVMPSPPACRNGFLAPSVGPQFEGPITSSIPILMHA